MTLKLVASFLLGAVVSAVVMGAVFVYMDRQEGSEQEEVTAVDLNLGKKWYYKIPGGKSASQIVQFSFGADGKLAGVSGCNDFSGEYKINGSDLEIGDNVTTTLKLCVEDSNFSEAEFMEMFTNVTTAKRQGDLLVLSGEGIELIFYQDMNAASNLLGRWGYLKAVVDGKDVERVNDSSATLSFESDGKVSGKACNSFSSTFTLSEDYENLSVAEVAATKVFCSEPEGVMDQESSFFTNLSKAKRYSTDGTNLKVFFTDSDYLEFSRLFD